MHPRIVSSIRKFYPKFGLAKDDIIFATFPKSGTTWFRFILANIISLNELDGITVDYKLLNEKLNTAIEPNWMPKIKYLSIPIIRSTHFKYNESMFQGNKSIYLYRNPKDTMVSYFHYRKSFKKNEFKGEFKDFIRHNDWGIKAWCQHFVSWISNCTVSISYEELKDDTFLSMKKIFNELGITGVNDNVLVEAINRSEFSTIKKMERELGLDKRASNKHKNDFEFARKGKISDGGNYFDEEDSLYLMKVLESYRVALKSNKILINK